MTPTDTARTRASWLEIARKGCKWHMPCSEEHVYECVASLLEAAAASQLAMDIELVKTERSLYLRGPVWDAIDDVLAALRAQQVKP